MTAEEPKRKAKSAVSSKEAQNILVSQAFRPNPAQRQAKTRYWALVSEQAIADDVDHIDPYELGKTLQCPSLPNWWEHNAFRTWFSNRHEHLQRIEYLFDLALDAAEQILQNEDPKAQSARVTMIKVLADLANKRRSERVADTSINNMTPDQLRAYIEKQAPVLLPKGEDE